MNDLYVALAAVIEKGDEVEVRKFLVDHLEEFPRDIQEKIAFEVFVDTVITAGQEAEAIAGFQKRALDILEMFDKEERRIDDAEKVLDIKEGL